MRVNKKTHLGPGKLVKMFGLENRRKCGHLPAILFVIHSVMAPSNFRRAYSEMFGANACILLHKTCSAFNPQSTQGCASDKAFDERQEEVL